MRFIALTAAMLPAGAFAQAATDAAAPAGSPLASFAPLILIFAVFYFLLIKPQQKRVKEHQAALGALKRGDEVVTGGGIIGKITKVAEGNDQVTIEIASGVEVRVLKSTISGLVSSLKAPVAAPAKKAASKNDNAAVSADRVANDN